MLKNRSQKIKKVGLSVISGLSLVLIIWLIFFGKIKASSFLAPLIKKIPQDEGELTRITEDVLGKAIEKVKGEEVKKVVGKGSEIFEQSEYAEPAREVRESIKQKMNEVVESVKELPAEEIMVIKRQVCKEWFEEVATKSGGN